MFHHLDLLHRCNYADHMAETRWWKYVQRVIGDDTAREAATRAGFDKSAFTRWKNGARADPEFVLKLARAYGRNVLEALVEAEFLTEAEASLQQVERERDEVLKEAKPEELLQHLRWRFDRMDLELHAAARKLGKRVSTESNVHPLIPRFQPEAIDDDIDDLDLPYVAHEPDEGIDEDDDESKYDV